jgi:hypothetical protein
VIEFHEKPNGPWIARLLGDGSVEFNSAVPNAEQIMSTIHPEIVVAMKKIEAQDALIDDIRKKIKDKTVVIGEEQALLEQIDRVKPEKKV